MTSKKSILDNNNKFNGLTYLDRYGMSCTAWCVAFGSETKISGYNGDNALNLDKMN